MDDNTSFVLFFAAIFAFVIIKNWVKSRKVNKKMEEKLDKVMKHLNMEEDN